MKCLRKAVNKTRRDKIKNEAIRGMVGTKPILDQIEHHRIKWFVHLMRMDPNNQLFGHTQASFLVPTQGGGREEDGWKASNNH